MEPITVNESTELRVPLIEREAGLAQIKVRRGWGDLFGKAGPLLAAAALATAGLIVARIVVEARRS